MNYYCPLCNNLMKTYTKNKDIFWCIKENHKLDFLIPLNIIKIRLDNIYSLHLRFDQGVIQLQNKNNLMIETNHLSVLKDLSIEEIKFTINKLLMLATYQ